MFVVVKPSIAFTIERLSDKLFIVCLLFKIYFTNRLFIFILHTTCTYMLHSIRKIFDEVLFNQIQKRRRLIRLNVFFIVRSGDQIPTLLVI